jgi:Flp pilus assembly protein protease CpaA
MHLLIHRTGERKRMKSAVAAQTVLILTGALLFYVALTDLKHFRIRNELILVLAGLFLLHAILSGRWTTLPWNFGFAAILFLIMLFPYSMKMMGGGDLKLLTVAILWVGPFCALPFALFLLLFAGIHAFAVNLKLVEAKAVGKRHAVAFAPSIAAALIVIFFVGCLRPA